MQHYKDMQRTTYIILGLLMLFQIACSDNGQYGKAIITYQPNYEEENEYFHHDHFVAVDMEGLLDTAVSIKVADNQVIITNTFNSGYTGHKIQFIISSDLDIVDVTYEDWSDYIDGSEKKYKVEKVILSMNANPFDNKLVTGHYTLQIREDYFAGQLLKETGRKDTTTYMIFNGKFKIYSDQEIKKGRKWLIDQNEIKYGIKDSLGVYELPDEFAQYKYGDDSLKSMLKQFEVLRSETNVNKRAFVTLLMQVDEKGVVNPESMTILETMKSTILIDRLKQNINLMTNWYPATYKGRPVKSEINLPIPIKE